MALLSGAEVTPRGLRRERAASYLGISPSKFDSARKQGLIPPPKDFLGVSLYCKRDLDAMFDELPLMAAANDNEWDAVLDRSL